MLNKSPNTKEAKEILTTPQSQKEKKGVMERLRNWKAALLFEGIMVISSIGVGSALQGCNNSPVTIEDIKSHYRKLNDTPVSMRANVESQKRIVFGSDTLECYEIVQGLTYNMPDFVAVHIHPADLFVQYSIGLRKGDTAFFERIYGSPNYRVQCLDIRITDSVDRVADFDFYIKE